MKIKDRTFVVSGGASGLGEATVHYLHNEGGYLAILDLNEDNGKKVVEKLGGERAKFFQVDVSDSESIEEAVKGLVEWTKSTGKQIGGVLAAAGVANPGKIIDRKGNAMEMEPFEFVLNINARGSVDLIRQVLPTIAKNDPTEDEERGVVIMVSSVAAYDGQPGQLAYAASKGAIASMALPMSRDLAAHGVRVMVIAPGVFESAMTRQMSDKVRNSLLGVMEFPKRLGTAEEFASLVGEIVRNRMLNGTVLRLDGAVRMPSKM